MIDNFNLLYHCRATRNDFIDIVFHNKNSDIKKISSSNMPISKRGYIDLYWSTDAFEDRNNKHECLPAMILMDKGEIRDFLAWTSTYFPGFTPLTSYTHVSNSQMLPKFDLRRHVIFPEEIWDALIGMILAEVYICDASINRPFSPDIHKCEMTFGFVLARLLLCGYHVDNAVSLYEEWKSSMQFLGNKQFALQLKEYLTVFRFIVSLAGENPSFDNKEYQYLFKDFFSDRDRSKDQINKYIESMIGVSNHLNTMQNITKEERYSFMNQIYQSSINRVDGAPNSEIIFAYLVNLISPGTMQHLDFFHGKKINKIVWLWYGVFAGLSEKSKIRDSYNYIGRRLFRDITKRFIPMETPTCDISSCEARIIFENPDNIVQLYKSRIINMQLAIGINSNFIIPVKEQPASVDEKQHSDLNPKKIIINMIKELHQLNSLVGVSNDLKNSKQTTPKAKTKRQKNLFDK